jgi:hypothetical protein
MSKLNRLLNYVNFLFAQRKFRTIIRRTLPKRHPEKKINREIFDNFFTDVDDYQGVESTLNCISNIWSEIILAYEVNIFKFIDDRNIDSLTSAYEAYYVYGISDGASSGKALNDNKLKSKKTIRNHVRAVNYFEASNSFTKKQLYFDKTLSLIYKDILKDISIPESIFIGQPWYWSFNKESDKVHFELMDYIYFSQICLSIIELIKAKNILVLGDGSGVNCALINANSRSNINLTHVDLSQYLLMQYIVNYEWRNSSKYIYAENFSDTSKKNIDLMINMDSFPEMTESEVRKYVNYIKNNNVKYLLSYNHKILDDRHTNFRDYLYNAGMELIISYASIIRRGWYIELFILNEK